MKNFRFFILLSCTLAIFMTSCTKDDSPQPQDEQLAPVEETSLSLQELGAIAQNFTSEYASFESEEQLSDFVSAFEKLDTDQQNVLLSGLSFTTLEAKLDEAYEGMDALETEASFENYISNYSNDLAIELNETGEKEVVELDESLHGAAAFINADRVLKVNDTYAKLIGQYRANSSDYSKLQSITSVDALVSSDVKHEQVIQELQPVEKLGWTGSVSFMAEKNVKRCKNDRRATLTAHTYVGYTDIPIPGAGSVRIYKGYMKADLKATRKGIVCIWYKYKTNITWNNFEAKYTLGGVTSTWAVGNQTTYTKEINRSKELDTWTGSAPSFDWFNLRTNATTTGLGGIWLNVNTPI